MKWLVVDDVLDELAHSLPYRNGNITTYVFDIADLDNPRLAPFYIPGVHSIDHKQYVSEGIVYQANFASGMRSFSLRNLDDVQVSEGAVDTPGDAEDVNGFFDCYPEDDAVGGELRFVGAWSVYPFFQSGSILLNSIERGIFSLKYNPDSE